MYYKSLRIIGGKSKWVRSDDILKILQERHGIEEFNIDDTPFNDTYHDMKLDNCDVLRKIK